MRKTFVKRLTAQAAVIGSATLLGGVTSIVLRNSPYGKAYKALVWGGVLVLNEVISHTTVTPKAHEYVDSVYRVFGLEDDE